MSLRFTDMGRLARFDSAALRKLVPEEQRQAWAELIGLLEDRRRRERSGR
jgi:hypothetical protein